MERRKKLQIASLGLVVTLIAATLVWWIADMISMASQTDMAEAPPVEYMQDTDDYLGMVLLDIQTEETAKHYHVSQTGVYVLEAVENAAAYRAGVRSGDRLVSCNGQEVTLSSDLYEDTAGATSGQIVVLKVARLSSEGLEMVTIPILITD